MTKSTLAIILVAVVCVGCGPEPEASPVPTRIDAPALGLSLASVPAPFELSQNDAKGLSFSTTRESGGEARITASPPVNSLNLQNLVKACGDEFRAREGGEYKGYNELVTPYGPAYYCRGIYPAGTEREEQTKIFALHPADTARLMTVSYTYPTGDGQSRVNELLGLLSEIEAMPIADGSDAEADSPTP